MCDCCLFLIPSVHAFHVTFQFLTDDGSVIPEGDIKHGHGHGHYPTFKPTKAPTKKPSPTQKPTHYPSKPPRPTAKPIGRPSKRPVGVPSPEPSSAEAPSDPETPPAEAPSDPETPPAEEPPTLEPEPIVPIIGRRTAESNRVKYELARNPYSWSESAHMIFLEQPIR